MKNQLSYIILCVSFLLSIGSCSKDSDPANKGELVLIKAEHGVAQGGQVVKVIGAAGGQITTPDGKITVDIPVGAVDSDVQFTIQPISKTLALATGPAYRLGPEDVTFHKEVKITFDYTEEDLVGTSEDYLYLAYQDREGYFYSAFMTEIDKAAHKVWVNTRHFSDWYLNRLFHVVKEKRRLVANEETALLLFYTEQWPDGRLGYRDGEQIKTDTWFVNGPGKVTREGNGGENLSRVSATYKAPASIVQPAKIAVGAQIKNMVNKTHPDRPGTSGLVIVQTEIELVPDEYFTWEVDGTRHVGLSNDAALMGSMTILIGTGLTGGISINLHADRTDNFDLGNEAEPDKFGLTVNISSGTDIPYRGVYYKCNDSKPYYGKGKLTIDKYGSIGGIISGSIEATVYEVGACTPKSKKVSGTFRLRRKL
ncbi:hypothetical protein [Niabella aquatica]